MISDFQPAKTKNKMHNSFYNRDSNPTQKFHSWLFSVLKWSIKADRMIHGNKKWMVWFYSSVYSTVQKLYKITWSETTWQYKWKLQLPKKRDIVRIAIIAVFQCALSYFSLYPKINANVLAKVFLFQLLQSFVTPN